MIRSQIAIYVNLIICSDRAMSGLQSSYVVLSVGIYVSV